MQGMLDDLGKGIGLMAGAFFGVPMVACLVVGGFGWKSAAALPACIVAGYAVGAWADRT